jgi:hypothetical protein
MHGGIHRACKNPQRNGAERVRGARERMTHVAGAERARTKAAPGE